MLDLNKLNFSFWSFDEQGVFDESAVKDWKELGIRVAMSYNYSPNAENKQKMIKLLDECEKQGISLIIFDDRVYFKRLLSISEKEFEVGVKEALKDFGSHKATAGFFIGDEPGVRDGVNEFDLMAKAHTILKAHSNLIGLINFLPYNEWNNKRDTDAQSWEYMALLDKFLSENKLDILAYDLYSSMQIRLKRNGLRGYFRSLNLFRELANKHNIPCWFSLLSCGHWNYRSPSKDDVRWMISSAAAHGMKGFVWFQLYDTHNDFCRDADGLFPIDYEGKKTVLYDDIRFETSRFMRIVGNKLNDYEFVKVWHYVGSYGGTEEYFDGADDILREFKVDHDESAIITKLKHKKTGNPAFMIVNRSQEINARYMYKFCEKYENSSGSCWLNAGQIKLVEL